MLGPSIVGMTPSDCYTVREWAHGEAPLVGLRSGRELVV
jgi:hypothetical protein